MLYFILQEKVRRQIFVEDDVPQEEIRVNINGSQFGNIKADQINVNIKARNLDSQKHDMSNDTAHDKGSQDISNAYNRIGFPENNQQHGPKSLPVIRRKATNQTMSVPGPVVPRTDTSKEKQESKDKQDFEQRPVTDCDE